MTTEQRLERLERENRWMKVAGMVVVAALGVTLVLLLMPAGDLVARSLTLENEDGVARARLHLLGLELADADGREWAALSSTGIMGPALQLDGKGGSVSLGALGLRYRPGFTLLGSSVNPVGRELGPTLALEDGSGRMAVLQVAEFTLYDGNGERGSLGIGDDGSPRLSFRDAGGKVIWEAPKD
jgi:hypothetical protein